MARILIVDDEAPVRKLLRAILERAGHDVAEATDGEDGIRRYLEQPADLVIVDILMPRKGGLSAIKEIRAQFPQSRFIATSGGGKDGKLNFLATARTFGGVQTIRKPFRRGEVLAAVNRLMEGI
jgi:CheY-like chemotaxis protein